MISTPDINTKDFFEKAIEETVLSTERKDLLANIAEKIANEYTLNKKVNLNFICTHNSRRSQLGQVWSFYAANYFNVPTINSFSGGTEATAFYKNTVKTLQKVGFNFDVVEFSHENPKYAISFENSTNSILGFSKVFDNIQNPQPFIAITTCNNADTNCPFIPTAIDRFHLPFVDPKFSDGSQEQDEIYLKTNKQIAAEVNFIFSEVKNRIA
jgi:arsenate reductase